MPAFGRKSDNSGCVAGRLLPRVGRETDRMEAERQIPARFTECDLKKQSQFLRGRKTLSIYMKGDYEELHALKRRKNKANSKPILFSPQIFWGLKNEFEKTKPIYSFRVLRAA